MVSLAAENMQWYEWHTLDYFLECNQILIKWEKLVEKWLTPQTLERPYLSRDGRRCFKTVSNMKFEVQWLGIAIRYTFILNCVKVKCWAGKTAVEDKIIFQCKLGWHLTFSDPSSWMSSLVLHWNSRPQLAFFLGWVELLCRQQHVIRVSINTGRTIPTKVYFH